MWFEGSIHTIGTANGIAIPLRFIQPPRHIAHNVRHPLLVLVTQFTPKVQMVGFLDQRRYRTRL